MGRLVNETHRLHSTGTKVVLPLNEALLGIQRDELSQEQLQQLKDALAGDAAKLADLLVQQSNKLSKGAPNADAALANKVASAWIDEQVLTSCNVCFLMRCVCARSARGADVVNMPMHLNV